MKEFKGLIGDKNIFFHSFKKIFYKNILNTKVILEFSVEVDPFFQLHHDFKNYLYHILYYIINS